MWIFLALIPVASCGLLGAGVGEGSCPAAPYRTSSNQLKWPRGCPASNPCCSEYGYCQTKADWWAQKFRDCNGESNGIALPLETIQAEAQFAQGGGGGGHNNGGGGGGWPSNGGGNNIGCGNGGCNSGYSNGGSSGCSGGGCGGGCRNGRCGGGGLTGSLGNLVSGANQGLAFPPNRGYQRSGGNNRRCKRCGKKK